MRLTGKIKFVRNFVFLGKYLITLSFDGHLRRYSIDSISSCIDEYSEIIGLFSNENYFFVRHNHQNIEMFNANWESVGLITEDFVGFSKMSSAEGYMYAIRNAKEKSSLCLMKDAIIVGEEDLDETIDVDRCYVKNDGTILVSDNSSVTSYLGFPMARKWRFDLVAELGPSFRFSSRLHTYGNFILAASIQNADNLEVLGLVVMDDNYGKLRHAPLQFSPQIDLAGDYAYGVNAHNHLYTYHIPTGEVKVHDLSGLMADHGFFVFDRVQMVGSKLYFTHRIGAHHAKAGILDYERKEMLWKHDFDADEGSIGTLKVIDGYVYFHMQDKTLHVFKED